MTTVQLKKVLLGNGETLSYRERSGGHIPLVLVHGNMTSSKHWDIVLENMDGRYKIYAVDMRGFGESSYHREIASIKDLSDDLKDWVDVLGLNGFSMMGWSTGGAVAMQYVIDHPDDCKNLILLASASTRGYPFMGTKEDGTPDLGKRLRTMEEVKSDTGKTIPVQAAYDGNDRDFLRGLWNALIYSHNQPEARRYEEYIDDMRTQRNLAHIYQALNTFNISGVYNGLVEGTGKAGAIFIPVLVIRGERDYVITKEMTEEIIEDIGENAIFVELKNSGHSPLIDDLDQLLDTIHSFLHTKEEMA
ncbi:MULTISPECIES: alpha/beta hydrolase [Rossellomorea]|uniref:intracellular short-chain-length polyhydroxyalkanoate depolymerase n=1 Tax=Rossellomorea TaxID=2837508 RepID=UPI001CC9C28E|nr:MULTISPECIES: alpha/beta hydrolase [Rossellomorea]MCA0149022.1 alpha/beta hydrolase [Rossellomorea vietnamensis]UTE79081.1 alpha/beta hydrolase [Rossellomorea sp. KS-H15a]WGG47147.1 alpha/beta hydrolase [Rossellomorea sp. DA94]